MGVSFVRPKLADLCFLLYSRPLHPELFDVYRQQIIHRDDYQAIVRITDTCHLVTWQRDGVCLTELVTTPENPLPKKRRLLICRLRGERSETIQCAAGVVYQTSFAVERLEREIFGRLQMELEHDAQERGISYSFVPPHRLASSPLSHITIEARARSLLVQTFHTFPDDCAIVKSQSLFEFQR